jgi:hypothetical protein
MMDPGCRGELEDVSMSAISALFGISWKHMTQRHSWTPGSCVPMAGQLPKILSGLALLPFPVLLQSTLKPSQPSFQGNVANVDVLHLS